MGRGKASALSRVRAPTDGPSGGAAIGSRLLVALGGRLKPRAEADVALAAVLDGGELRMAEGRCFLGRVKVQLQKRLPQELPMAAIKTVSAANRYLKSASCPTTMPALPCRTASRLWGGLGIGT